MKLSIIAVLATGLVVGGCQTVDLNNTLSKACSTLDTAHSAFVAATLSGEISQRSIDREQSAYEAAQVVCTGEVVNTADAIIRITTAVAIIIRTQKEIK